MSHKLYDITLYYYPQGEIAKQFTVRQNIVSDLYVQYLDSYKPPKTSRISVTLGDEDSAGDYFGSILCPSAKFDKEAYWKLNDNDKNKNILTTVHRIALLCAEKYNWDKTIFENAYKKVLDNNFKYEIEGKKKLSKDKKHKAAIHLSKNLTCAIISVAFYDKLDNHIKTVELLKSFQHEMFYGYIIKNNKWFNNNEFGLYTSNEELIIKVALDGDKTEILITPKVNTKEVLDGYLRRITYHEINNQEDLVNWMGR